MSSLGIIPNAIALVFFVLLIRRLRAGRQLVRQLARVEVIAQRISNSL